MWRACSELSRRHGASRWRLERGRLHLSNAAGLVASYVISDVGPGVLRLRCRVVS
jgi:hypothetical protein